MPNSKTRPDCGLAQLENLGPTYAGWLNAAGIDTQAKLADLGAIEAYRRIHVLRLPCTLKLLYALEGALRGTAWTVLPHAVKARLKAAVDHLLKPRCPWCGTDPLYVRYHDEEWGVPNHDERKHFEFLILEGAQAGLSWLTILRKRQGYRRAFADFDVERVARFGKRDIKRLLADPGIVRNRLKIESAVSNARAFLKVQDACDGFDRYIWRFVDGEPRQNRWRSLKQLPARTAQSDALSKDLKGRGFRFVGSTIMYAHMQAIGLVNDHLVDCHRYHALRRPRQRS